jgi:hypothetical protein
MLAGDLKKWQGLREGRAHSGWCGFGRQRKNNTYRALHVPDIHLRNFHVLIDSQTIFLEAVTVIPPLNIFE